MYVAALLAGGARWALRAVREGARDQLPHVPGVPFAREIMVEV